MASLPEMTVVTRDDIDTKSMVSLQELEPSPVEDTFPDIELGDEHHTIPPRSKQQGGFLGGGFPSVKLGLRGQNWDSWLSALQKYSTYPPTVFFVLHFANTSIIPLATRSVAGSENYLLLTRPVYQSPSLEHLVLTLPVLVHIASGITLRNIRSSRHARLYGSDRGPRKLSLTFWRRMSLQARLGYLLAPLLGTHVLVNRITPLIVEGGSSGVGLGFVAHGIARSPIFWNLYYLIFVAVGVWHFIGGLGSWMGWRVTTTRKERSNKRGSLEGYLGYNESDQHVKRRRKIWWIINGIAALGTSLWLAGALGVVGRGGPGSGWEANNWNKIYSHFPIIGAWL